jgi:hypothetical protein
MAECFWPGVTRQNVEAAGARAHEMSQSITAAERCARHRGSILVPTDEIALFLLEAESLDAAIAFARQAAIPAERVLEIVRLDAFLSRDRESATTTRQRSLDESSS